MKIVERCIFKAFLMVLLGMFFYVFGHAVESGPLTTELGGAFILVGVVMWVVHVLQYLIISLNPDH
jgi:antibiotic biosynthesis monooxygenase (ABM) superfamily enzyme